MSRRVEFPERYVPADGAVLVDDELGYLIGGFTAKGDFAQPGERFYNALWSRDRSGTCSSGQHGKCAHRTGGRHQHGCTVTGADESVHVWRCGCTCHLRQDAATPEASAGVLVDELLDAPQQLALFGEVA